MLERSVYENASSPARALKLLSAAKGEGKPSEQSHPTLSLFKKGKKQYAYVQNKPSGAVTEPGLKAAAGDSLEVVMARIDKALRKALD